MAESVDAIRRLQRRLVDVMVRQPGYRFFFGPDEVEPLGPERAGGPPVSAPRVLVACIGNVFLGDDGFGVAVARRLATRPLPEGALVVDFGIRGYDLAMSLTAGAHDAAVLVDATPRGGPPGTLYVIDAVKEEVERAPLAPLADPHAMEPAQVLRLARHLGPLPARVLVVGCEPGRFGTEAEGLTGLSEPVAAAVGEAAALVAKLVADLAAGREVGGAAEDGEP